MKAIVGLFEDTEASSRPQIRRGNKIYSSDDNTARTLEATLVWRIDNMYNTKYTKYIKYTKYSKYAKYELWKFDIYLKKKLLLLFFFQKTLGFMEHSIFGPNVVFETLELYISSGPSSTGGHGRSREDPWRQW